MGLFLRQPCHGNQTLLESVSPSSSSFFSLTSKKTVYTNTANCILFVVCYVMIEHPNTQTEEVNMQSTQGTAETDTSITCSIYSTSSLPLLYMHNVHSGSIYKPLCVS